MQIVTCICFNAGAVRNGERKHFLICLSLSHSLFLFYLFSFLFLFTSPPLFIYTYLVVLIVYSWLYAQRSHLEELGGTLYSTRNLTWAGYMQGKCLNLIYYFSCLNFALLILILYTMLSIFYTLLSNPLRCQHCFILFLFF